MRAVWIEGAVNRVVYVPVAGTQGIIKFRTRPWEDYLEGHRGSLEEGSRKDRVREALWSQTLEDTQLLAFKMEEAP